jgi:hypothetical protein
MNIIFDIENVDTIKNSSVVLELDTFYFTKLDKTLTAYCVIDNIKITDFDKIEQNQKCHAELIEAYKQKDFKLCQNLLEHLLGAFDGEIDSFYAELQQRIQCLKEKDLDTHWSGVLNR